MKVQVKSMKKTIFRCKWVCKVLPAILLITCGEDKPVQQDYPIMPVSFTQVEVADNFWAKRIRRNHEVTIPIAFKKAEETGRIRNFRMAAGLEKGSFSSLYPFDDSDVYKNIEAASYSLQLFPDPGLEQYLDSLISYIAAAQEDDGYLYTNRTIDPFHTHEMAGPERWINEEASSHELYNAGHLYEAAVAHFQATGKRTLLDVALKNADLIDSQFGWGKIEKAPGHQEIEIGLVKLYRLTGEKKYLDLARFFLEVRGPDGDSYNQMHEKVLQQRTAVGHAVRAQYMYAAMADVAALTGQKDYLAAIDTLWADVVSGKTYLTGGIGSVREIEGFGEACDLPNMEAYCETCAAIANALWNYRMFLLHGESKYFDVFEKVLYNGLLSGVSLSGDHFFYPNPLESDGQYSRKPWFGCACCPVNITRFLPSLPGYIYATNGDELFVNLFIGNHACIMINGKQVELILETDFPWDGDVSITVVSDAPQFIDLRIRIPGWAENLAFPTDLYYFEEMDTERTEFIINGKNADIRKDDGYASISRVWHNDDKLLIRFPVFPRKVKADRLVKANTGKVAIQRGPLIYCLESADQPHTNIPGLYIQAQEEIGYAYLPGLLDGVGVLTLKMNSLPGKGSEEEAAGSDEFRAIPYFSWANRGPGEMTVWIPEFGNMQLEKKDDD